MLRFKLKLAGLVLTCVFTGAFGAYAAGQEARDWADCHRIERETGIVCIVGEHQACVHAEIEE